MADVILKAVDPVRKIVYDYIADYVSHVASCDDNLGKLRTNLKNVCLEKDAIDEKVVLGKNKLENISRTAASWLKDVSILTEDVEMRSLMKKDAVTAKHVVNLMEKNALKTLVREDGEMQKVVVKVMNRLKKEVGKAPTEDHMKKFTEGDYKRVIEVVVEVMKDTTEEFKMLIKKDNKVAVMATKMLKDKDLDELMNGDEEMGEILEKARNVMTDDDDQETKNEDKGPLEKDSGVLPEEEALPSDKNSLKEAAKKLLTPLENLIAGLKNLTANANFQKAIPQADSVKLVVDVIDGLVVRGGWSNKEEMDDDDDSSSRAQNRCCGCNVSASYFRNRYKLSIAAENMAKRIQDDILGNKCPGDRITVPASPEDKKPLSSEFTKGLQSRSLLLENILEKLKDDKVVAVGVYGMGGAGKTTLAKEVKLRVTDMFDIIVMVEVSNAPDIGRIQEQIAESIDLPLHDLHTSTQRANKLYNRLVLSKESRILVILDNIWKKLNIHHEVGIPPNCRLLLTTREKEVCKIMDVKDNNIFEVGVLNGVEARALLKSHVGDKVNDRRYESVIDRLLGKCAGLPLAIVATANALRNKDLLAWKIFADELSKPVSSQINGVHHDTYMIMETSFKFMESQEKKLFFLLACLSPLGSSVSIEDLMRYGIGLDLFQHVDNLSDAMEQANRWAHELVLSSMLLESGSRKHVQIHDVTRASAIFFAAKDKGLEFMVEAIPRWLNKNTFRKYTAISLQSRSDYSRLNGVNADKLQILILKGNLTWNFDDSFFNGMQNLEVLSLSDVNLDPRLPESIGKLKNLKTLLLEGCKLGDIEVIGKLVSLLVLSLRESLWKELPSKLGELCNLRLLDLTSCRCRHPQIPAGVLGRLSELEGLYMLDSFTEWVEISQRESGDHRETSNSMSSTSELQRLRYLNDLEIHVPEAPQLPLDGNFFRNLDRYRITFGDSELPGDIQQFHRVFSCGSNDVSKDSEKVCLKALSGNAKWLRLEDIDSMATLVPEWDDEGFRDLVYLQVSFCHHLVCLVSVENKNNLVAFPHLESLKLYDLECLRSFCDEEALLGMFPKLQHLEMSILLSIEYMMPLSLAPCNLTDIYVRECDYLVFLFIETFDGETTEDETSVTVMGSLRSLKLDGTSCKSMSGIKIRNNLQGHEVFFNNKVQFPSLEIISISRCKNIVKLWSENAGFCGFQNLKEMTIWSCRELLSLGHATVFSTLVNLETLTINNCEKMLQVITEEINKGEVYDRKIIFPKLKVLEIKQSRRLECFYDGTYHMEFPSLKKLELNDVCCMNRFGGLKNSSATIFHEKIELPCLEKLALLDVGEEVKGLWNWHASPEHEGDAPIVTSNPVPMLTWLELGKGEALWLIPSMICKNLTSLELGNFDNKVVFSSSSGKENFRWKYDEFPNLKKLGIEFSETLVELFEKTNFNVDSRVATFFERLKDLRLESLQRLNLIPLDVFKGLCYLDLNALNWEYLISADALLRVQGSLRQLEVLEIESCNNLSVIIKDDVEADVDLVYEFPRLKQFHITSSHAFIEFSSTPKTKLLLPALESLHIQYCHKFQQFWSGLIMAPKLKEVDLTYCRNVETLFTSEQNNILELPSLQVVHVDNCPILQSLSSGPLIAAKLQQVELTNCNMRWFSLGNLNQDDVVELSYLKEVKIRTCCSMQSFSCKPIITPNLTKVDLYDCSNMQWILSENTNQDDVADFPFLETVKINACPDMKSMCSGILQAPKLTHVMFNGKKYSMLEIGDLNQFIRTQESRWGSSTSSEDFN